MLISHAGSLPVALAAARAAGLPRERIVTFDTPGASGAEQADASVVSFAALVAEGLARPTAYAERRLAPGEGKTKLAFLSFSSGTTGRPKVRVCPRAGARTTVRVQAWADCVVSVCGVWGVATRRR